MDLKHKNGCGCPSCFAPCPGESDFLNEPADDYQFFGFGLGITTDESGQSWLGGKKIVGWQGDTPMTQDAHGNLFANIVNMTTGNYMPGVQMPTTIAARGGGRGPIATAPTGSGRVFWADDGLDWKSVSMGLVGGVVLCSVIGYFMSKK